MDRDTQPKRKGLIAEAFILAALLADGWSVAQPFGDNERSDFIVWKEDSGFQTVQCKLARKPVGRTIKFANNSVRWNTSGFVRKGYSEVDYFGVYSPEWQKTFLIPVELCNKDTTTMRYDGKFKCLNCDDFRIPSG